MASIKAIRMALALVWMTVACGGGSGAPASKQGKEHVKRLKEGSFDARLERAEALIGQGRAQEAKALLEALLAEKPKHSRALFDLG
ncbi:MAG: tetratricopeptide repeat protein, partial [Sandaracinaceae bacterium]|nr:tetratricopeptide repeat protein [Sandaracinaceae bacterium]